MQRARTCASYLRETRLLASTIQYTQQQRFSQPSNYCPVGAVKLEEAANWCGIPFEANRAHRALYDAQMTAELFRMMLAGDLAAQREAMSSQVKSPSY